MHRSWHSVLCAHRAALITTAITLFILTTNAAGKMPTVALASNAIDLQLKATSQTTRNWGLQQLTAQLNHSLSSLGNRCLHSNHTF
jgi:hypothetical protein